ncbi:nucleotidyltransferase family protein [uncultured Sphingomonas sp.]|uniref:nucleotidyltransferase family protein n=1 Tax=uncultured Sphingomonas sp. TaxID=158754 RepID=UPI0035CBD628
MLERVRGHAPAIREIVARHGASDPRLFGSVARGEEHGASDVDFLVDHRPTLSLLGLVRMERELAALLDRDVDVVVDDEVPEKSMARILHDAIPL